MAKATLQLTDQLRQGPKAPPAVLEPLLAAMQVASVPAPTHEAPGLTPEAVAAGRPLQAIPVPAPGVASASGPGPSLVQGTGIQCTTSQKVELAKSSAAVIRGCRSPACGPSVEVVGRGS